MAKKETRTYVSNDEEAQAEVAKWSKIFPGYRSVVNDIKAFLHSRDQRGADEYPRPQFVPGGRR